MIVTAFKTPKVVAGHDLTSILDTHLPLLKEKDIVVVTGKIVSICQGRLVKNDGTIDKHRLIEKESEYYIDPTGSRYDVTLTIKHDILIASAGIDESNGNDYFILWPENPEKTAAEIWQHLRTKHAVSELGVIITDSRTTPLRWGTLGVGLSWCGLEPLKNYIGAPDIFGRNLHMTKLGILDGLAAAAVVVMGEGNEQTPLALIRDVPFVQFQDRPPTKQEVESMRIALADDIYAPLVDSSKWQKGGVQ